MTPLFNSCLIQNFHISSSPKCNVLIWHIFKIPRETFSFSFYAFYWTWIGKKKNWKIHLILLNKPVFFFSKNLLTTAYYLLWFHNWFHFRTQMRIFSRAKKKNLLSLLLVKQSFFFIFCSHKLFPRKSLWKPD